MFWFFLLSKPLTSSLTSPFPCAYISHPSDLLLHGISGWRGIFVPDLCPSLSQRPSCSPCIDVTNCLIDPVSPPLLPQPVSACKSFKVGTVFLSVQHQEQAGLGSQLRLLDSLPVQMLDISWHSLYLIHPGQRHQLQILSVPHFWGWDGESGASEKQHLSPSSCPV